MYSTRGEWLQEVESNLSDYIDDLYNSDGAINYNDEVVDLPLIHNNHNIDTTLGNDAIPTTSNASVTYIGDNVKVNNIWKVKTTASAKSVFIIITFYC